MKEIIRVILDLRGLLLQAYHGGSAVDQIRDEKGELQPTAIHGLDEFIRRFLEPILAQHAPINIIGVLEGKDNSARRRALVESYKQDKPSEKKSVIVEEEKRKLMIAAQKLLLGLGAILVSTPYCEADDTIKYLCDNLKGSKLVHTVDGDLLQMVNDNVAVCQRGVWRQEYNGMPLSPYNCVAVYKSIVGDTSDGYVGVRGMGQKSWDALVEAYGYDGMKQLEECVRVGNYDMVQEALESNYTEQLDKLYKARDEWAMSYRLAVLHPEWCELSFRERVIKPEWAKRVPSEKRLRDVLEPMGLLHHMEAFKRFMPRKWLADKTYMLTHGLTKVIPAMLDSRFVAFDYESYDKLKHQPYRKAKPSYIDPLNQVMTGCSFAFGSNMQYCFYVPTKHRDTKNVQPDVVKGLIEAMQKQCMVAHNSMFEQTVTYTNFDGLRISKPFDTVIMSSYVNENTSAGLKFLSKYWLNYDQIRYSDVVKHGEDMRDVSGAEVMEYGCDDSLVTAHLTVLFSTIMECERTWDFYEQNEPYFEQAMLGSFVRGVKIDTDRLAQLSAEDDELYNRTYAELRGLLETHCSTINEDGFTRLWAEIEPFEKAKLEEAGRKRINALLDEKYKDLPDDPTRDFEHAELLEQHAVSVEARVIEKRQKLYPLCRYNPIAAPVMTTLKKDIARIGKALGLPGIRSVKPDWLHTYCSGIATQVENGADITEQQQTFVHLLKGAAELSMDALDVLESWMNIYAKKNESLWSGDLLNAGSPDQIAQLFYGKMGLPILLRNQSKDGTDKRSLWNLEGAPSTGENAIRTWLMEMKPEQWEAQVLQCVLTIRGVRIRRSLYYVPYPLWVSPDDGMIHPQVRNCGTVTRRPSGTAPNVFQVSKTKDDGKTRSAFKPHKPGDLIVSIDFVQQELVIIAGESGDANLRACYIGPQEQRKDVHHLTAREIYNGQRPGQRPISYAEYAELYDKKDKLATDIRKKYAKNTNFLEVFGGGPRGMARKIIVPLAMAEGFDAAFHNAYPGIKPYQQKRISEARRTGMVRSCFGGVRHLPNIWSKNKAWKAGAERQSGNFPVQGGAAEVLKIAMRDYVLKDIENRFDVTLIAPVYDEFVASVPAQFIAEYLEEMASIMEIELPGLNIRLSTSASVGASWGDQKELGTRPSREVTNAAIAEILAGEEK